MSSFFNMDSPIMRFLSRVCDLIILNLLAIACCIPIVTAGASITALFSVTLKMVKGEESYIFKGFFKGFKENFKQSTIIWLILLVLGLFLFIDYRAATILPGNMKSIFQVLIGAIVVIYSMVFTYIFPYTARFRNDIKNIFKNSLLIAVLNLPWTLVMIICPLALFIVTFLTTTTLVYGSMIWILLGFATIAYFNSIIFRKVFAKYEPKEEEEDQGIPDSYELPEDIPEQLPDQDNTAAK